MLLSDHTERSLKGLDVSNQWHRIAVTDVEDPMWGPTPGWVRLGRVKAKIGRRRLVKHSNKAFTDVIDIGKVIWPLLKTWMGSPLRMARVNKESAMSGRPHGPYTVKNRIPVAGKP
jgi:hypothetical protein